MNVRCQDLVIGTGPGGSITAGLLAEHGRDVVMLEEGPGEEAGSHVPFSIQEFADLYRNRGLNPCIGTPKTALVEGCCLGGGSEINSGLYHKTPPEILDEWKREYGLRGASEEDMAPHFCAVEESISVCCTPGPPPLAARKLKAGADVLGWKAVEVPRWVQYNGDLHPDGSPVSTRMSMTKTWIPRARRAGVRLLTRTRALELERRNGGWKISAQNGAGIVAIEAGHVFLCCGAVQTPILLRRSGIRHNVGNTLAIHPTVKVLALFEDEVNYEGMGVPFHQVKEFSPEVTMGCSVSSPPYLALAMSDHPSDVSRVLRHWKSAAVYYVSVTGSATGKVRSLPITGDALVRWSASERVLRSLAAGLGNLCRLLFAAGAIELFPSIRKWPSMRSVADLANIPDSLPAALTSLMTIHMFCSVPMGEDRTRCAVDSWGRVYDTEGLSVHDASVFCDAPSVNPQGSVMAFARRNTLRYLDTCRG